MVQCLKEALNGIAWTPKVSIQRRLLDVQSVFNEGR